VLHRGGVWPNLAAHPTTLLLGRTYFDQRGDLEKRGPGEREEKKQKVKLVKEMNTDMAKEDSV